METQSIAPNPAQASTEIFDLAHHLERMKSEKAWKDGTRNAVTLLNDEKMRIVLILMRKDAEIKGHRVDFPISVQVIEGEINFQDGIKSHSLKKGQLLALQAEITHGITAVQESAFLLTMAANQPHPAELKTGPGQPQA